MTGRDARSAVEDRAMRRAIELAAYGLGTTSPNPVVGCVILDQSGEIVGEGFHAYAGGPHAEVRALAAAGVRARGGTALVTLEPCNHTGRTGPCSQALISAGIVRVVAAVPDPNPVARGGAEELRAAGIEVDVGLRAPEAYSGNVGWLTSTRRAAAGDPRPYVIWKFAATLDGRSAAEDGTSQWITSPDARADVQQLRSTVDRNCWTSARASGDVIHWLVPSSAAERPSNVAANFQITYGRGSPAAARRVDVSQPTLPAYASPERRPSSTSMPAARSSSAPPRAAGFGSGTAATTRNTPAETRA